LEHHGRKVDFCEETREVSFSDFSPVIIYSLTTSGKPIDQFSEASNLNHPTGLKPLSAKVSICFSFVEGVKMSDMLQLVGGRFAMLHAGQQRLNVSGNGQYNNAVAFRVAWALLSHVVHTSIATGWFVSAQSES
jgi:hypothetical protein